MLQRNNRKILIFAGGPRKKLDAFEEPAKKLGLNVTLASFYDIEFFSSKREKFDLKVKREDISNFDLIYFRVIGRRIEDASLVVNYAAENGVRIIDGVYEKSLLLPSTISKAMEIKKLIEGKIPIPPTFFGSLFMIREKGSGLLGFPFVIKGTSGKKGRDAWLPKTRHELDELITILREREKKGERFFAQKLIKASQRIRVLVVGGKVLGAVTRPTKWRKRWIEKLDGDYPEAEKAPICPVPEKFANLAIAAANAAELDISGIDILEEDKTGELFVIEANAAPSWNLIKKDLGINVEEEILKFLARKANE